MTTMTATSTLLAEKICPKAPPGAVDPTNDITSYVLWGVIAIMGLAILIGLGAVAGGRLFSMPHASKVGVMGIAVIFVCCMVLLLLSGMFNDFICN